MITKIEEKIIRQCARKYNLLAILLFGSSLEKGRRHADINDIDLAVKGVKAESFFYFYAELFKRLSKPVDLIDLSKKSLFNELIEETGERIYG